VGKVVVDLRIIGWKMKVTDLLLTIAIYGNVLVQLNMIEIESIYDVILCLFRSLEELIEFSHYLI
jgi:hypothetical protein